MRERRLVWVILWSVPLLVLGQLGARLWAAPPSVAQTLQLKPIQAGVEIDTPTEEEIANCTVSAEKIGDHVGWVVKDGRGYVLRRFPDTNHDNRPDRLRHQWRAVVDRWPTLKADQTISANHSLAMAA